MVVFLDLVIIIKNRTFVYKLFDRKDVCPFSIALMSHIDNNIQQIIIYSAIKGKFLRIVCWTLCLHNFITKAKYLLKRIKKQGSKDNKIDNTLEKIILVHFQKF